MDLTLRLENHWLACMAALGGGARVTRTVGALVVVNPTAPGYAFNFVALRSVLPGQLAMALELGSALLSAGGRPPAAFLSPAAGSMEPLAAELAGMGWCRLLRQTVLVRQLPVPEQAGAVRAEAITAEQVPLWAQTLAEAYEVDPLTGETLGAAWGSLLTARSEGWWARGYIARVDGLPAGTGLLWSQGEIAGLYCGAVLPAYRRRGAHRELVTTRLADATAAGCRLATLQTETGSPVERLCVESLGFTLAHHRELWARKCEFTPAAL